MNLFRRIFNRKTPTENDVLNKSIALAMEFGENWLTPIQARLKKKFPALTSVELDNYNEISNDVLKISHEFVYKNYTNLERKPLKSLKEKHRDYILSKFNWLSERSISNLLNQGLYYANKG